MKQDYIDSKVPGRNLFLLFIGPNKTIVFSENFLEPQKVIVSIMVVEDYMKDIST